MARARIGLWLIGAKGGVATTALTGLIALKKGLMQPIGLVSALPQFAGLELLDWKDLVCSAATIFPRSRRLFDEEMRMHTERHAAISEDILQQCKGELDKIEKNLRPGTLLNVGPTIAGFCSGPNYANKKRNTTTCAIRPGSKKI